MVGFPFSQSTKKESSGWVANDDRSIRVPRDSGTNQSSVPSLEAVFAHINIGVKRATGERASAVSVFRTQTQLAIQQDHKMARHFGELEKYYGITVRVVDPNIHHQHCWKQPSLREPPGKNKSWISTHILAKSG